MTKRNKTKTKRKVKGQKVSKQEVERKVPLSEVLRLTGRAPTKMTLEELLALIEDCEGQENVWIELQPNGEGSLLNPNGAVQDTSGEYVEWGCPVEMLVTLEKYATKPAPMTVERLKGMLRDDLTDEDREAFDKFLKDNTFDI